MEQDFYLNVLYIFIYLNVESFSFLVTFQAAFISLYVHFPFFSLTLDIFLYKNLYKNFNHRENKEIFLTLPDNARNITKLFTCLKNKKSSVKSNFYRV